MKIMNKQKTHYMQKSSNGLLSVEYDTIENVNLIINAILDKGSKQTPIGQALQPSKKELKMP